MADVFRVRNRADVFAATTILPVPVTVCPVSPTIVIVCVAAARLMTLHSKAWFVWRLSKAASTDAPVGSVKVIFPVGVESLRPLRSELAVAVLFPFWVAVWAN